MALPHLYVPEKYESRYALLGTFCREVGDAAREAGLIVNPPREEANQSKPAIFTVFNFPPSLDHILRWIGPRSGPTAVVQWLVDHPFNLDKQLMTEFVKRPGYRFVHVTDDDAHLLQLRWPNLVHGRVWHGVPRSALCNASTIASSHHDGSRDIDVFFAGSIATDADLDRLRADVPPQVQSRCEDIVQLRLSYPWLSFGQAFDVIMPSPLICPDAWGLLAVVFRYTTAKLNRERRLRLVRGLEGLRVAVAGSPLWKDLLPASSQYVGEVAYEDVPQWMRRSKVCIALNPTQFVHGFSERLLLALAGGCATVTDDRLWVREHFTNPNIRAAVGFVANETKHMRDSVQTLLADANARIEIATRGRTTVEEKHLWVDRIPELLRVVGMN
jgi:spore maturation protein CgeB